MDRDLAKELFHTARRQYDSAVRWSLIVLSAVLFFHLMLYAPYIELYNDHAVAKEELAVMDEQRLVLSAVEQFLHSGEGSLMNRFRSQLRELVEGLRFDLSRLNRSVELAREEPQAGIPAQPPQELQMAQRILPFDTQQPRDFFPIDDPGLRDRIKKAPDMASIRALIRPLVERDIVTPHFAELNSFWKHQALPRLEYSIDSVVALLREPGTPLLRDDPLSRAMEEGLTQIKNMASEVEFAPPEDSSWWASVEDKERMAAGLAESVERDIVSPATLSGIVLRVESLLSRQQEVVADLENEMAELKVRFERMQDDLASLGQSFTAIAVNLDGVVARFPILIAICLAWVAFWTAKRARDLAAATDALVVLEEDAKLWDWFRRRVRLTVLGSSAAADAMLLGAVALVWVGVASVQLLRMPDINLAKLTTSSLVGIVIALAAVGYRRKKLSAVLCMCAAKSSTKSGSDSEA